MCHQSDLRPKYVCKSKLDNKMKCHVWTVWMNVQTNLHKHQKLSYRSNFINCIWKEFDGDACPYEPCCTHSRLSCSYISSGKLYSYVLRFTYTRKCARSLCYMYVIVKHVLWHLFHYSWLLRGTLRLWVSNKLWYHGFSINNILLIRTQWL